mmetsp:Transcript_13513/g.34374  ORF Transcript_13513/g.34374 Transcript_13513/m.34374 type:complete len:251 (-) Transcript_13513:46-798(-)
MWGLSREAEKHVLAEVREFENGSLEVDMEPELLDYRYISLPREFFAKFELSGDSDAMTRLWNDHDSPIRTPVIALNKIERDLIHLPMIPEAGELMTCLKLAYSHGAAQSSKLESFETAVEDIFNRVGDMPVQLAETGHLNITDEELLKLYGELYTYSAYINLQTDILETPDWFWDNEDLEPVYLKTAKYLDISKRTVVLNIRLKTLNNMYALFRDERNLQSGYWLTWIVIWLIIIEVVIALIEVAEIIHP